MVDVRRPARAATPAQTTPSSRQGTWSLVPSFDMPLEILEQIPTRYLAPLRYLVETFFEEDYVRMMGRNPEEMILAQARTAAYVSMINRSSKSFVLSLTLYSNDNSLLLCRT